MHYTVAVKGIIEKDGKILVVKRCAAEDHAPEIWETVGGRMDHHDAPEQELVREVREEAGIEIEVIEPFDTFSFYRDTGEYVIGITFICKYLSGEVTLSDEHSEYKWIDPGEFAELGSMDSLYKEIAKYAKSVT